MKNPQLYFFDNFFLGVVCDEVLCDRNKGIDLSCDTLIACREKYHPAIRGGALVGLVRNTSHRVSRRNS